MAARSATSGTTLEVCVWMMSLRAADPRGPEKRDDVSLQMWPVLTNSDGLMISTSMLWTMGP
eukprot:12849878-Heterocapsa_arctica.AAC.1